MIVLLARSSAGSIAIVAAIVMMALVAAIGTAIDISRITAAKVQLQQATDSATLFVVRQYSSTLTSKNEAQITNDAFSLARAELPTMIALETVTPSQSDDGSLCLRSKANLALAFGPIFNIKTSSITGFSCAFKGSAEVALALDNSSSMIGAVNGVTKMKSLQTAVSKLVAILNPDPSTADVPIAVVPFADSVNVGPSYKNAAWIDQGGKSSVHWQNITLPPGASWKPKSRFDLYARMGVAWSGCVDERPVPYLTADTPATGTAPDSLFVPSLDPDEAGGASGSTYYSFTPSPSYPADKTVLGYQSMNSYLDDTKGACKSGDVYEGADASDPISHGSGASKLCKYDGQKPAAVDSGITGYKGNFLKYYPAGPTYKCTTIPFQPLTTDVSKITGGAGVVPAMAPNGQTNLLPGFMWAWRLISPNGPFASTGSTSGIGARKPIAYGANGNKKYVILMTDGFNYWSKNDNSPYRSSSSVYGYYVNNRLSSFGAGFRGTNVSGPTTADNARSQVDAALLVACSNAKAAGIEIFSVGFSAPVAPIDEQGKYVLQTCASSPSNYYLPQSSSDFVEAFTDIANRVRNLRLAK